MNWRRGVWVALAACIVLRASDVQAKDFRREWQWWFTGREKGILDIVLAFEQSCDKGCKYRAPRVVQAVVLSRERLPESFYVWIFAEDIRNAKWFSRVTTRHDAHGTHVEVRMVPDAVARKLASDSGKPNEPGFDASVMTWDIEESFVNGQFTKTHVTFTNRITLTGLSAFFGGGVVQDRMAEAAHAMYADFAAAH